MLFYESSARSNHNVENVIIELATMAKAYQIAVNKEKARDSGKDTLEDLSYISNRSSIL